ncbi:MAG: DUF2637 domain-containing protein [Gemmataceae bacterium]|nr:DUF2637 domain-containing protein [Gemmataceae bacterium]
MMTAVAGTVLIAGGAFWLSFTALADLARRSGIDVGQAWAWPLIVDGIIVVATVAVVALAGTRTAWYPWMLLICGAGLSVTANSIHAIVAADADVPAVLAAAVAAVPPLVLLAITHLTVILTRHQPDAARESETASELQAMPVAPPVPAVGSGFLTPVLEPPPAAETDLAVSASSETVAAVPVREVAEVLRAGGWSNKTIARHLGVHPSTVGRWWHPQTSELDEASTTDAETREPDEKEGS